MAAKDKKFDRIFSINEETCQQSMVKNGDVWLPVKGGKGIKEQKSLGKIPLIDVLREEGKKKIKFQFLTVDTSFKKSGTKSYAVYMRCVHNQKLTLSTPQHDFSPNGGTIWNIKFECDYCSSEKKTPQSSEKRKKSSAQMQPPKKIKMSAAPLLPAPTPDQSSELRNKAIKFGEQLLVKAAVTIQKAVNQILSADVDGDIAYTNMLNEAPSIGILVAAALSNAAADEKLKFGLSKTSASILNHKSLMSHFKWSGADIVQSEESSSDDESDDSSQDDEDNTNIKEKSPQEGKNKVNSDNMQASENEDDMNIKEKEDKKETSDSSQEQK